jgi:hypothetical protein
MSAFYNLVYMILGLMADIDSQMSYEAYQEWCQETNEARPWDCIRQHEVWL